jgi:hypothetical protein
MWNSRPPLAIKKNDSEVNKWVYDKGPQNGPIDYEKYGHAVAKPGPVISAKTGKIRTTNSASRS